ncbi:MAG: Holliday junction branch migration protein RuvA [Bacteroidota bacterium]|nr:Holliday junction branch migration protein RuvA [Bacteroidota bacterium]
MFEYIKGKIVDLKPANVVLESGFIGWFINISLNSYSQLNGKSDAQLFIHEVIREDAHLLYGFAEASERELFRLLVSVSGIGSNTAMMMLSSLSPDDLCDAIMKENVNALKGIKGIGVKTAQRVIIELKDKIGKRSVSYQIFSLPDNTVRIEALSALVMLGFNKKDAEKTIDKILKDVPQTPVELVIKTALKQL